MGASALLSLVFLQFWLSSGSCSPAGESLKFPCQVHSSPWSCACYQVLRLNLAWPTHRLSPRWWVCCPALLWTSRGVPQVPLPRLLPALNITHTNRAADLLGTVLALEYAGGCYSLASLGLLVPATISVRCVPIKFCGPAQLHASPPPAVQINHQVLQSHSGKPTILIQNLPLELVGAVAQFHLAHPLIQVGTTA